MVTDPVRTKGVRCGYCARCSSCYRERVLRGAPTTFRAGYPAALFISHIGHQRDCLGTLESSQSTGLRLGLTMSPPTSLGGELPSRHAP